MNETDQKVFHYMQERINEPDMSKAIKKAILFTHLYFDEIKERVPLPVMEILFDNKTYKHNLSLGNFQIWARENLEQLHKNPVIKPTKY